MGGCRCVFRECGVGTSRYPRMHFFRFPYKDKERFLKWTELAKVPNLLQMPTPLLKNKCVCARHFRDECFMNYMKDKLTATAVPTLERIKGGYALDYDDGDKPKIVKLPDPVLPHMIPPPGFECPLHLEELENEMESVETIEVKPKSKASVSKRKKSTIKTADSSTVVGKKVKILNTQAHERELEITDTSSIDGFISKFVQFVDSPDGQHQENYSLSLEDCIVTEDDSYAEGTELQIVETTSIEADGSEAKTLKVFDKSHKVFKSSEATKTIRKLEQKCKSYELQLEKERSKYATHEEDSSKQQMQLVEALQTASLDLEIKTLQYDSDTQELKTKIEQLTVRNNDLESKCVNLSVSNSLLKDRLKTFEENQASLQEKNKRLEAKYLALQQMQEQQQVSTVSTSKEAPSNRFSTVASEPTLPAQSVFSKAQLFNGIKKYLSSSMIALVRMEMFGSAERQWKPDEKQASLDLLTLGENVYKYFTDEWRFRLPGMRQVLAWRNEASAAPDDEEDL